MRLIQIKYRKLSLIIFIEQWFINKLLQLRFMQLINTETYQLYKKHYKLQYNKSCQNCIDTSNRYKIRKGIRNFTQYIADSQHKEYSINCRLVKTEKQITTLQNTEILMAKNRLESIQKTNIIEQDIKSNRIVKSLHEAKKAKKPQITQMYNSEKILLKNIQNIQLFNPTLNFSNQKQVYPQNTVQASTTKNLKSDKRNYISNLRNLQLNKQNLLISEFQTQSLKFKKGLDFQALKLSESIVEIQQKQMKIEQSIILNFNILNSFQIIKIHQQDQYKKKLLAIQKYINIVVLIKKYNNPNLQEINNQIIIYNKLISHPNILNHYKVIIDQNQQVVVLLEFYDISLKNYPYSFTQKNIVCFLIQILQPIQYLCWLKINHELIEQNIVIIDAVFKLANFEKSIFQISISYEELKRIYYLKLHQLIVKLLNCSQNQTNNEKHKNILSQSFKKFLTKLKNQDLEFPEIKTELYLLQSNL